MNLDLYNFHLQSPAPIHSLPILRPLPCQQAGATSLTPLTASCGTMGSAAGLLGNFITPGSFAHAPLPLLRGDGTEGSSSPITSCVHSVNSLVPVSCDQQRGSCCLVVGFSSHSTGSPSSSVPVTLFSLLGPVHLVSPLQFSQFQAELCDYPDQTATAYVLTSLLEGFHIGFETSSVTLGSASSNMRSALVHQS